MSTINTKIKASYFEGGIRLPFESPSCGEGYTTPGPVTTYKLSPEELARYGPPGKVSGKRETVYNFKNPHQREAEELANRLERLKKALTKEEYLEQKAKGGSDAEICTWAVGEAWRDAMPALKKEWGLETKTVVKKKDEIRQAVKVDIEKPVVESIPPVMIIDLERFNKDRPADIQPAKIKAIDGDGNTIMEFDSELIEHQEITALAAADEFYTLQEDCEMLDEEISRLTKERVHITDRMQLLKEALEKVVVVI